MEIPSGMLIGVGFALTTPVGKAMQEAGLMQNRVLNFAQDDFMAVFLLTEIQKKKDDSSYKSQVDAYLALLSDETNFPSCYSDDDLNMLHGSTLQE
jgi:hypothetical protein